MKAVYPASWAYIKARYHKEKVIGTAKNNKKIGPVHTYILSEKVNTTWVKCLANTLALLQHQLSTGTRPWDSSEETAQAVVNSMLIKDIMMNDDSSA